MNGFLITLIMTILISIMISFLIKYIVNKNYKDKSIQSEIEEIKKEIKSMQNQYYMLNLDVEKSRQKLNKSISFLETLKHKQSNYNIDEIKSFLKENKEKEENKDRGLEKNIENELSTNDLEESKTINLEKQD